ncbi:BBSome-interacting protein 1-like [Saccostrea echinata]|uniref:BBSome-interacting protein 1-like n=1 Tax=Saccostrea echinata TaxID=191078 RepID=UPI002A83E75B|nr:BBSome-interacting protein 1-like [Saccostrea echinata]
MPETKQQIKEVLPKQGLLYQEDMPTVVLCKPKILPLKSVTLEKLERMQREAQDTVKQQEAQQQHGDKQDFFSDYS